MTKKEAEREFRVQYPDIHRSKDIPMRNQTWGFFIDSLCKNKKITLKQYETWGYPSKWKKK